MPKATRRQTSNAPSGFPLPAIAEAYPPESVGLAAPESTADNGTVTKSQLKKLKKDALVRLALELGVAVHDGATVTYLRGTIGGTL